MSIEHLFKGKTIKEGLWVVGSLIVDEKGNCYIGEYIKSKTQISICSRSNGKTENRFLGIGFAMVDKDTVCEYTRLTDKNDTKIFEGDIVTKGIEKFVVKWNEEQARFDLTFGTNGIYVAGFNKPTMKFYEVNGNIFDNKELLNKSEKL